MPRHDEQYVPAFKTRIIPCPKCHAPMEVGWKTRMPKQCIECACATRTAAMIQMHDRIGPYYDRWKASMLAFLNRELGGDRGDYGNIPDRVSSD